MDFILFTEQEILERVDEYALYCFYLNQDVVIGAKTPAPEILRRSLHMNVDNSPSFGVFERTRLGNYKYANEFLWKDLSAGVYGDIFDLVKRMYGYETRREARLHVCAQMGLGGDINKFKQVELPKLERKYADPVDIQVKSKPWKLENIRWWGQFNISPQILDAYHVTVIQCYWVSETQKVPSYPKGPGYAYRIADKYQLYFPLAPNKKDKFRQNLGEFYVHGVEQLQYNSDTCIITKSRKDVMCLRSFGYESVAPRSENTMLPKEGIEFLKRKYRNILVLFDNDGKHNGDNYEFNKIYVPKLLENDKDPTDFCSHHGVEACSKMLKSIIKNG